MRPGLAPATAALHPSRDRRDAAAGKLVVVIDDDPLVLQGMGGLLEGWGCNVVTGRSGDTALAALADNSRAPDLIISDYRLRDGRTGAEAISELRRVFASEIPAFLISGDTDDGVLREATAEGYPLLHKPVSPMALRAAMLRALKDRATRPMSRTLMH